MDVSSEATLALLPVYLVNVLGATALQVGVIEGIPGGDGTLMSNGLGAVRVVKVKHRSLARGVGGTQT